MASTLASSDTRGDTTEFESVPVIDIGPLLTPDSPVDARALVVDRIAHACTNVGFFYIKNHGISEESLAKLESISRKFFKLPVEDKQTVALKHGGKAWRGWFPLGDELTSGRPDQKEGYYFGTELASSDPRPMHGANIWPAQIPELRDAVLTHMESCASIGQTLMRAIAEGLGLDPHHYSKAFNDPLCLFRIFTYPPVPTNPGPEFQPFGVQEHTDYGYVTLLKQDSSGGLQVKRLDGSWIDAPPIDGTIVVNLGDALEHNTGGLVRATPHRVKNAAPTDRLSFPFFFDPNFDAEMKSVLHLLSEEKQKQALEIQARDNIRWDGARPEAFEGTYGKYVMGKVGKVFPTLFKDFITET